tara:strand:- start:1648 stop:2130 length:483 start_codon:yes stop_codon:yes gene_type:complete
MSRVRLHLGSGDKHWPLWVNVDAHGEPDVVSDCKKLPFDTDYADEIQAIHFIEHIARMSVDNMLMDWHRVLKRGGKLVVELPCLNKMAQHIVDGNKNIRMTTLGIFGDPRDKKPGMMHQWAWTKEELSETMRNVGFKDVTVLEPVFHHAVRDMRIEAIKP